MSDLSTAVPTPKRRLRRIPRTPGETRETILAYAGAAGRISARLVRVEGGGVDRTTGAPLEVYFELTVKVPREPEVTRPFAGQGDPVAAEWNARVAYLMAQHGVTRISRHAGRAALCPVQGGWRRIPGSPGGPARRRPSGRRRGRGLSPSTGRFQSPSCGPRRTRSWPPPAC